MNKLEVAKLRAEDMLAQYGVGHWGIEITNSRKTLAVTDHDKGVVELSKRFILLATEKEFDGIMHHEIAHIIAGRGRGHGEAFVKICKEISPDEKYSCISYPIHIKPYKYTCSDCGVVASSEKIEDKACVSCLKDGKLNPLKVEKNTITPKVWASTP